PVVPWLAWWAVESKAIPDAERLTGFFSKPENRKSAAVRANVGRLVRRYAADGTKTGYTAAHKLLTSVTEAVRNSLLEDLDRGLAERSVGLPDVGQGGLFETLAPPGREPAKPARKFDPLTPELCEFIGRAWEDLPADTVRVRLAMRAEIATAREFVHAELASAKSRRSIVLDRLAILQELGDAGCVPVVLPLLASTDADVQKSALTVLAHVGGAEVGEGILKAYPAMPAALRSQAREALFGRKEWAKGFLATVDAGMVKPADVPVEQVRRLALLGDKDIDAAVRKHWGSVKPGNPEEKLAEVRRFANDLRAGPGDAVRGKTLFTKHCGACHKLFGEGGAVGPDLTNTSRADTAWLLASTVDPSALVRAQYVQFAVRTADGLTLAGVIAEQDGASVTLADAKGERTRVPRDRVESLRELSTSLMPEKLLDPLTPQQRRDLFKYLQQPGK
ncbi:MAG TPA: c-type cytochrome, partial [Gemmataceae bacterium]|nr:c-type cytochrome [Gemmataceae bacterium]